MEGTVRYVTFIFDVEYISDGKDEIILFHFLQQQIVNVQNKETA